MDEYDVDELLALAGFDVADKHTEPTVIPVHGIGAGFDPATIPPRRFIVERRILAGLIHALLSPGGVGKTTWEAANVISIGTGRPLLGERVIGPGPAWIINNEEPHDELMRRVAAVLQLHRIEPAECEGRVFITSGYGSPYVFARRHRDTIIATPNVDAVIARIRDLGIVYVSVDPFVSTHGLDENKNEEIEQVATVWRRIAAETGAAITLVHHTRKTNGDSEAHAGDAEAGRGASALKDATRAAHTLARMSQATATRLNIPDTLAPFLVRLDNAKANYAPPDKDARWFRLINAHLPNGDDVAVPVPFDLATAPAVANQRDEVRERVMTNRLEDLAEIMSTEPHTRSLSDVLRAAVYRWDPIKDRAARDTINRLIPIVPAYVEVGLPGRVVRMRLMRSAERDNAPLQVVAEVTPEALQ